MGRRNGWRSTLRSRSVATSNWLPITCSAAHMPSWPSGLWYSMRASSGANSATGMGASRAGATDTSPSSPSSPGVSVSISQPASSANRSGSIWGGTGMRASGTLTCTRFYRCRRTVLRERGSQEVGVQSAPRRRAAFGGPRCSERPTPRRRASPQARTRVPPP